MATLAGLSFNVQGFGRSTSVPDDDVARLMYYLNCVTVSLGFDILQDDLVDYQNYHRLNSTRIALVIKSAAELTPDIFIDRILFRDDAGEVVPSGSSNKFVSITSALDLVSIQRDFILGGQVKDVTKVMFFKSSWLNTFYNGPIERIAKALLESTTKHCSHCEGDPGMCACSTCPRSDKSQCKPIFESFLDALTSTLATPAASSSTRSRSPAPPPVPARAPPAPARQGPVQHQANCDGCGWQLFTGPRYKCNNCYDFDLCQGCYSANKHLETSHHFRKYETPESSPVYLPVRRRVPPPPSPQSPPAPPPPYAEATRTNTSNTSNTTTTTRAPEPGPPLSSLDRKAPLSPSSDNVPFYHNMSISELKSYLTTRDVEFSASEIVDKESLCKLVWETHVDCMSIGELNTYLSQNRISTAGCRDVNARRQKAKDAFEPPSRPAAPPTGGGAGGWRKDDIVVLTGLSRADMNGRKGVVQVVHTEERKVTVFIEDMNRAFKVKYDNVTPWVEVEDLGAADEAEELS
ncbi:hypothetical protein MD484_g6726, partial [Candolleomyces efflorescens]